jgi:Tfp pilus assembly protein FimT
MKQLLKTIIRNVKSVRGNSLAEFATTTALMATLAATAAPKLSEMSEGAKGEKSRNEIDKIIKMAGQFYQDQAEASLSGRGRFPNQSRYDVPVGGFTYSNNTAQGVDHSLTVDQGKSLDHTRLVLQDLGMIVSDGDATNPTYTDATSKTSGWDRFDETPKSKWQAVFGNANADLDDQVDDAPASGNEWDNLFGDEVLGSTFQDGQYVYTVVAGGGTGVNAYPPTIYVVDVESAVDFNNVLMP